MDEPSILGREPVMVLALVQAVIAVALAFGAHLTGEQIGAVMALAAVVIGLIARSKVTPTV